MTGPSRRTRLRGSRHSLGLIAGLFLGSAALRLGASVPAAIAAQGEVESSSEASVSCVSQDGVMELLQAVREREAVAESREASLSDKERSIELAMTAMQRQRDALIEAEKALETTLAIADQAAEKDVARLVTVYESMKPKQAIPLFEEIDAGFAAGFIARMKPEAAAAVLAGMDPQKAYLVSAVLAGRNALAPTE